MDHNEMEVVAFMGSIRRKYFPELHEVFFEVVYDDSFEGVMGRALFGKTTKVILHYSNHSILEPRYRMGLVPVIAHELAHFIDPVDPERIMSERLPQEMMKIWEALIEAGHAKCSMGGI
jgi:hypothetical protein